MRPRKLQNPVSAATPDIDRSAPAPGQAAPDDATASDAMPPRPLPLPRPLARTVARPMRWPRGWWVLPLGILGLCGWVVLALALT